MRKEAAAFDGGGGISARRLEKEMLLTRPPFHAFLAFSCFETVLARYYVLYSVSQKQKRKRKCTKSLTAGRRRINGGVEN